MTDSDVTGMNVHNGQVAEIAVEWRDVATVVVDSVVGFVTVANIPRVTLGQVTYAPGGAMPRYQPVVTIAAAPEALRFLSQQLLNIADQIGDATVQDAESEG